MTINSLSAPFRWYATSFGPHRNVYLATLANMALVMVLYSVCRLLFYAFNHALYPEVEAGHLLGLMGAGLRFDLSAVIYLSLPYLAWQLLPHLWRYRGWYQRVGQVLFLVPHAVGVLANCLDIGYFPFAQRRTTLSLFREFGHEANAGGIAMALLRDYWYLLLIWGVMVALSVWLYRRPRRVDVPRGLWYRVVYVGGGVVVMLLFVYFGVVGMRGGFGVSTRPISPTDAGVYVDVPLEVGIVLNTPFTLVRLAGKQSLPPIEFYKSPKALAARFDPVRKVSQGPLRGLNVAVIILESLGREYIGAYNTDSARRGYTPFLDSLIGESCYFADSYANGMKSIDGMPSVLASIPPLVEHYFTSSYSANRINSIASLLRGEGYETAFFHGAHNGSMGFSSFARLAGFDRYYGLDEYPAKGDFDGTWAVWDEEFLQFFAERMEDLESPFVASVFTASSHHPFHLPARYADTFPEGELPIHRCVAYSDHALRRFFETARRMPWYENTLFVITADHTNMSQYPEYSTPHGRFAVPIIFYLPGGELRGRREGLAQQIDILPTVMGLLGFDRPFVSFGRDLFDSVGSGYVINHSNGFYQLMEGDYLYLFNEGGGHALYNLPADPMCRENLLGRMPTVEAHLDSLGMAIAQQYSERMRGNRMVVE